MYYTHIHTYHMYNIYTYIKYYCIYITYMIYQSPSFKFDPRGILYYFYNHARRLRPEKILYLQLSRSPSGYFNPLLGPGGGFRSETAFYVTVSDLKRLQIYNSYRARYGHYPTDTIFRSGVVTVTVPVCNLKIEYERTTYTST
jgi:hypothetical protein